MNEGMGENMHDFRVGLRPVTTEERRIIKCIDNKMEGVTPEEYDNFVLERKRDEIAKISKEKLESFLGEDIKYRGLELGSGTGIYTEKLNEIENLDLSGLEIRKDIIDYGINKNRFRKGQVILGDFQEIPFKENSFDLGTGLAVTRQREDVRKFYSELKRVIKKDGLFFLPFIKVSEKIIKRETKNAIENGFEIVENGDWYILMKNKK